MTTTAIRRIAGFSLTSANAARLMEFYTNAFACVQLPSERRSGSAFDTMMGVRGGAECYRLNLGQQVIEILEFAQPGTPYPQAASPEDNTFQHFAIVVSDIQHAVEQLSVQSGWTPISHDGPQLLPASSGGVTAYKFRDPDGHPLEFLQFPADSVPAHWRSRWVDRGGNSRDGRVDQLFLGIDHSAISVADTNRSTVFYRSLGFEVAAQTTNHGPEQARLDGLQSPQVEVTALASADATPHLELLCYRTDRRRAAAALSNNDVAATRLVLERGASSATPAHISVDPDGHHLHFIDRAQAVD